MNRYPGVKPFDLSEQALFFGRDRDIADLCSLVRVEKLAVLFGKSGYGKSSLLNAGVLPRLSDMFLPIEVRLGEYIAGQSLAPLETLRRRLDERTTRRRDMDFLADLQSGGKEDALWRQFKQAGGGGSEGFLLVLDQFEEFFSYPPDQQADIKTQLAALLHEEMPESLHEAARDLPREQRRLLAAPPQVRVLLAVRSDRLHELDRLKDALPAILHKRYELRALSREQAREAITGPALLMPEQGGDSYAFDCPPFEYREDALQHILDDLTRNNTGRQGGVEAFQLQILCDSIESMVAGGRIPDRDANGLPDVSAADLPPNFDAIYGAYYERRLEHLPEQHRAAARLLIEDGLVRYDPATDTKRRLSVDGDALLGSFARHGLTPELLRELEKTY
ncbi:MAG TPA: hypothetical protein VK168_19485, partial [Saprospiraceae bacterium]|nr:hypothetical protein [Saprospiraceae bacterium]